MFIGSTYDLVEAFQEKTMFGWNSIKIMERVLSSTRTRVLDGVPITSYSYSLLCLVENNDTSVTAFSRKAAKDTAEIDEDELHEEVISGYYKLAGWEK
jgi:hypothetical protein